MFSMIKVEAGLIVDVNMYLFGEKGMRSGVSYISKRYNKAKNEYLISYDSQKTGEVYYILGQKQFIQLCYVKISSNVQM